MSNNRQKLELTWIGKNNPEYDIANIEPRILEERTDLSYGDQNTQNMIIHGDNLLALKALLPEYEGKVKCIYIDPPYNTGNAFEHYDDSVEHSTWLSLMKPRLELLRILLSEEGSIWITLDDVEVYYFKILCDEVFGSENFIGTIIWEKSDSPRMDAQYFSTRHDYIMVYSRNKNNLVFNKVVSDEIPEHYNKRDDKGRLYYLKPLRVMGGNVSDSLYFAMIAPDGTEVYPHETDGTKGCWRWSKRKVEEENERIEWVNGRKGFVPYFKIYAENRRALPIETIWAHQEVGSNRTSKNEIRTLFSKDFFDTPKPEKLLQRILSLSSKPEDLVLDSFLGSGTTIAVAHKMGRQYIGIEMGEHAYSHVHKRMKKVVDGADGLKFSEALGWQGGGGFKFYELAPSFVTIDEFGNPVIDSHYNDTKLIRAMCKLMNYTFSPSPSDYWRQGKGQGNNSIYVTTQMLSVAMVQQIVSHLSVNETLLICPKKYEPGCEKVDQRITIKKIPQSILKACHFGKKEYLLPIKERAIEEIDEDEVTVDEE